jgi:hypothetical protein
MIGLWCVGHGKRLSQLFRRIPHWRPGNAEQASLHREAQPTASTSQAEKEKKQRLAVGTFRELVERYLIVEGAATNIGGKRGGS